MFPQRLKEARKFRGYTAQYMADALQTGIRNYRKYESGDASPTLEGLSKLADILGVSTDFLLGRKDGEAPSGERQEALQGNPKP